MSLKTIPKNRVNNIVVQELSGELLIYDLKDHKAYCLNTTSALIWNLCDGFNTTKSISEQLSQQLKCTISEELVFLALEKLNKENLLANDWEIPGQVDRTTRREMIRKVGLASMVALPVVASLTAPTAATAASTCPTTGAGAKGTPCTCSNGTGTSCTSATCAVGCVCGSLGALNTGGQGQKLGACG